jgi:hypothetical protein
MAGLFRALPFPGRGSIRPFTTRIEPNPVSGDPAVGLMAQVWDPLWMLARQWQLGELAGEDTGTPLAVTVEARFDPLVAWHPGPFAGDGAGWRPLGAGELLEPLVEDEPEGALPPRAAAAVAWALQDALAELGEGAAVAALIERCGVERAPSPADPEAEPAGDWSGIHGVLAGAALDAARVAAAFSAGAPAWFTAALRQGPARRRRAMAAVDEWLAWYAAEIAPAAAPSSWLPGRLEYEFAVATTSAVLHAPAHGGGEIGWAAFDLEPDRDPPDAGDAASVPITRHLLASQLTFPGMPTSRFWEFEDADLDLGQVWADPHELARVLVVEAALVTGDDWLVLPVDCPPGGVLRVARVTWRDTFGSLWFADEQPSEVPGGRFSAPWRMFTVTESRRDGPGQRAEVAGVLVPPAPASALVGAPVEDVRFLRDETANLVWAIEQTVPAPSGDPSPVVPPSARGLPPIDPGDEPADQVLGYELVTFVPGNWFPYVARVDERGVVLQRADLDRGDDTVQPGGVLLSEEEQRIIFAGEVPRQGVRVQRVPRLARRADGSWVQWIGRHVRPAAGEGESGLRFDRTRRPTG